MHWPVTLTVLSFGRLILFPLESFTKYFVSEEYAGIVRRFVVAVAFPWASISMIVYFLPSLPVISVFAPGPAGVGVAVAFGVGVFVAFGVGVFVAFGFGVGVGVFVAFGFGVGVADSFLMSLSLM